MSEAISIKSFFFFLQQYFYSVKENSYKILAVRRNSKASRGGLRYYIFGLFTLIVLWIENLKLFIEQKKCTHKKRIRQEEG